MGATRVFKSTINERIIQDPEFARNLLDEAITHFLNGDPEISRLILRDLINSTIGFEELAIETSKSSKSLHRMLSARGNPTMENLNTIFEVLRKKLNVKIDVKLIRTAPLSG